MPKKIACLGSAPSSIAFAPWADKSWCLWGCSPALYPQAKRLDAWFELHRMEAPVIGNAQLQVPWYSPEYVAWMSKLEIPVFMSEPLAEIPESRAYPIREMIQQYGPYIWTSSLAYMMTLAMEDPEIEEIGLWGVDMGAKDEYAKQRPALQFLIWECQKRGIKITVPPESDLLQPGPLYGIDESTPKAIKLLARKRELEGRHNMLNQQAMAMQREVDFLKGAIDATDYDIETWTSTALNGLTIKPKDRFVPRPVSNVTYIDGPALAEPVAHEFRREPEVPGEARGD